MKNTYLIKVFHSYSKWKQYVKEFFQDISKTLEDRKITLGVNFSGWEIFYSLTCEDSTYSAFESQFYSYFNEFQITPDEKWVWNYDLNRTIIWELKLENSWFYPFKYSTTDHTEFIFNIFRSFENFWVIKDKVGLYIDMKPIVWESFKFFIKSRLSFKWFKIKLAFRFFKYLFNNKISNGWKDLWDQYFKHKLEQDLFETKIYIVVQSDNKEIAKWKLKWFFNNFTVYKNYPLNEYSLKIHEDIYSIEWWEISWVKFKKNICTQLKNYLVFFIFQIDQKTKHHF